MARIRQKSDQDADKPGRTTSNWRRKSARLAGWESRAEAIRASARDFPHSEFHEEACAAVVEALNDGVAPSSIFDAILLAWRASC